MQTQSSKQWENKLAELREKRAALEATAAEARDIRAACALDAEMGDPKAKKQLAQATETLRFSELSLETNAAAIVAAEGKLGEAHAAEAAENEHQRRQAMAELAERRLVVAAAIDKALQATAPLVEEYRVLGAQIEKLEGKINHQLTASWRLEAAIDGCFSIGGTAAKLRKTLTEHESGLLKRYIESASDKAA